MILLRPFLIAGRNRIRHSSSVGRVLFRDGILLALAIFLMCSIYFGTTWILKSLHGFLSVAYLSPALPLTMVLLMLFGMLVISNIVGAVGAFFLSEDLDLLLASPLNSASFFFQRLSIVGLSTSWISLIFLVPVIVGYGVWFHQPAGFYLLTIAALVPYFIIPAALSYCIATFLIVFVPLKRSKILLLVVILMILAGLYSLIDIFRLIWQASNQSSELVKLVSVFSASRIPWLPSTWVGETLTGTLGMTPISITYRLVLLYGVTLISISLSYLAYIFFYHTAYSSMKNHKSGRRYSYTTWRALSSHADDHTRQWLAVVSKDVRLLSRDMSQLFQGILLLGVYLIYIYNIRIFSGFHAIGPEDFWWRNFLFISNFCMSAFISCALCTRFVFPSISLEGRCFSLVLTKSPYSIDRFVKGKFLFWYGVVAVIHSLVVATGAFASGATSLIIIVNILCSWIMCYGLVGLAIGMGAIFSRFDWEHVSQLAVGFGNIVFMLSAAVLILLCMIPVWFLIFGFGPYGYNVKLHHELALAFLFCVSNFAVGRVALKKGVRALYRTIE